MNRCGSIVGGRLHRCGSCMFARGVYNAIVPLQKADSFPFSTARWQERCGVASDSREICPRHGWRVRSTCDEALLCGIASMFDTLIPSHRTACTPENRQLFINVSIESRRRLKAHPNPI